MLQITNQKAFNTIVSDALSNAIINAKTDYLAHRWENAITKAVTEIETNPFMNWDEDKKSLLIMSDASNNIYAANGVCQCKAYAQNQPCYHRAAARIWRLYLEALEKLAAAETAKAAAVKTEAGSFNQANAIYLKRDLSGQPKEMVGGIRI